MNRKSAPFISALIILFLATPIYEATVEVALGSPTTTIFVNPPTSTVAFGQTFFIDIKISDVSDLYGWEFKLRWTSTLLDALTVTEGNFLKQGGETFFTSKINNTNSYILVDCTLLGNISGASGSGTLASVSFYPKNQGESILDLYDTIVINSQEIAISHTNNDGTVTVSKPVGGTIILPNKLELLAPWIELASTIIFAVVAGVVFVKRWRKDK
jgi:hypothetical protein